MSYGKLYRTPRWSTQRAGMVGFAAYFVGTLIAQVQRAQAHFRFTQSLENPRGFVQALQNVNVRLGGDKPLPWTLPQVGVVVPPTISQTDVHGDTARPDEGDSVWASDPTSSALPVSPDAPAPVSPGKYQYTSCTSTRVSIEAACRLSVRSHHSYGAFEDIDKIHKQMGRDTRRERNRQAVQLGRHPPEIRARGHDGLAAARTGPCERRTRTHPALFRSRRGAGPLRRHSRGRAQTLECLIRYLGTNFDSPRRSRLVTHVSCMAPLSWNQSTINEVAVLG